jgi:hypothetical protein
MVAATGNKEDGETGDFFRSMLLMFATQTVTA